VPRVKSVMFLGGNMLESVGTLSRSAQYLLQRLSFGLVLLCALVLSLWAFGALLGLLPWLGFAVHLGDQVFPHAGVATQIAGTVLAIALAGFLPSQARIMALESAHRDFAMGMQDVAHAYHLAHAADRAGVFQLPSEFDSIRERLAYMRRHPDLANLEPDILELAAQMSYLSRALAETYSDANVGRAKMFLSQRQQEVNIFRERLKRAEAISRDLQQWLKQVEAEEAAAAAQLSRLRGELADMLPEALGIETRAPLQPRPAPAQLQREAADSLTRAAE
jgi:hypothetical protein